VIEYRCNAALTTAELVVWPARAGVGIGLGPQNLLCSDWVILWCTAWSAPAAHRVFQLAIRCVPLNSWQDFFRPFRQGTCAGNLPLYRPFKKMRARTRQCHLPVTQRRACSVAPEDGRYRSRRSVPALSRRHVGLARRKEKRGHVHRRIHSSARYAPEVPLGNSRSRRFNRCSRRAPVQRRASALDFLQIGRGHGDKRQVRRSGKNRG